VGLLRIFLAFVVIDGHLRSFGLRDPLASDINWTLGLSSLSAVMIFYVISGFLIGFVLDEHYGFEAKGIRSFYIARASRIYSLYWPLFAIMMATDFAGSWHIAFGWKTLTGIFLFGSDWTRAFATYPDDDFSMFPPPLAPAWTLGAEMMFYLLAPFLLRRTAMLTVVLIASFALHVGLLWRLGFSVTWQAHFFPATLWLFLLGAAAWRLESYLKPWVALVLLPLAVRFAIISDQGNGYDTIWAGFALVCLVLSLPGLFAATRSVSWMNFLGNLSYPFYLLHMSILYALFLTPLPIAVSFGKFLLERGAYATEFACIVLCLGLSILAHYGIERPMRRYLTAFFERCASGRIRTLKFPRFYRPAAR
jgi:peptidoglycan/LPS O-acetylase OafA/YrhL